MRNHHQTDPKKFAFVGYDDSFVADKSQAPSLTSINHDYEKLGTVALDLIINKKNEQEALEVTKRVTIDPFLTKRNSSGPVTTMLLLFLVIAEASVIKYFNYRVCFLSFNKKRRFYL